MRHLVTMIQILFYIKKVTQKQYHTTKTDSDNEQYIDSPYMTQSGRQIKRKCPIDYEDLCKCWNFFLGLIFSFSKRGRCYTYTHLCPPSLFILDTYGGSVKIVRSITPIRKIAGGFNNKVGCLLSTKTPKQTVYGRRKKVTRPKMQKESGENSINRNP